MILVHWETFPCQVHQVKFLKCWIRSSCNHCHGNNMIDTMTFSHWVINVVSIYHHVRWEECFMFKIWHSFNRWENVISFVKFLSWWESGDLGRQTEQAVAFFFFRFDFKMVDSLAKLFHSKTIRFEWNGGVLCGLGR